MYQIYVSVMVAAALAAIWLAAIAQVEVIAASFSVGAAEEVVRGLGLAAAVLFGVSCFKALRGGPFSFSDADVALLLTGPIRLQLVLVAELVPDVAKTALVGALVGFAAGVACAPLMPSKAVLRCVSWQTAPLVADVLAAEVALVFALGSRADAAALAQESLLSIEAPSIGLMACGGDAALLDEVRVASRRRKVSARVPLGRRSLSWAQPRRRR